MVAVILAMSERSCRFGLCDHRYRSDDRYGRIVVPRFERNDGSVELGETLLGIADEYSTTVAALEATNNLTIEKPSSSDRCCRSRCDRRHRRRTKEYGRGRTGTDDLIHRGDMTIRLLRRWQRRIIWLIEITSWSVRCCRSRGRARRPRTVQSLIALLSSLRRYLTRHRISVRNDGRRNRNDQPPLRSKQSCHRLHLAGAGAGSPRQTANNVPGSSGGSVIVAAGDTLMGIAHHYGTTVDALATVNNLAIRSGSPSDLC